MLSDLVGRWPRGVRRGSSFFDGPPDRNRRPASLPGEENMANASSSMMNTSGFPAGKTLEGAGHPRLPARDGRLPAPRGPEDSVWPGDREHFLQD